MGNNMEHIDILEAKAQRGDASAMFELGCVYCNGLLAEKNKDLALYWFNLAKKHRSFRADKFIDYVNSEKTWAVIEHLTYDDRHWTLKVLNDENESPIEKGKIWFDANCYPLALKFFQQGYDLGHIEASYWLGVCYEKSAHSEEDYIKACRYYMEILDSNNDIKFDARDNLIKLLKENRITDSKLLFVALDKIVVNDLINTEVRLLLAHCYFEGIGTDVDKKKALALYREDSRNLMDSKDARYNYEYGKLEIELSGSEQLEYANGVYRLVKAMEQHSKEATIEVENLLLDHDPYALIYVISLYRDSSKWGNPQKAVKYIKEYISYCKYDQYQLPSFMSVLAEYYFKGHGVVHSFVLAYFWLALSMSLVEREYDSGTKLMNKLMQLLDLKDLCALQKIVKEAHRYIRNLPESMPPGDLEDRFMSSFAEIEDYNKLINSNINLSIELAELKNAKDGSLDKAVSYHSYFSNSKFDVEKVTLLLCVKDPTLGNRNEREDMVPIDRADLDGLYIFYEDQKDYKNFRVFNQRIGPKIRNYLLKLAYYSKIGGEQLADLLPNKIDDTISRLNTMFRELFKPYLDKVNTPFIDLNGFQIEVTLDHPEYIDPAQ